MHHSDAVRRLRQVNRMEVYLSQTWGISLLQQQLSTVTATIITRGLEEEEEEEEWHFRPAHHLHLSGKLICVGIQNKAPSLVSILPHCNLYYFPSLLTYH